MIKTIIDFGCLPQLVTNFTDSMKLSESKQLAVYIFAYYIVMALTSPLFSGFAVQNFANQQLRRREVRRNKAMLRTSSGPYVKFGQSRLRKILIFLGIVFMFFKLHHCTHLMQYPVIQNMPQACLTVSGFKYLHACGLALIGGPLGLSFP